MAKPYDAALNALIDASPDEWVAFLAARIGIPAGPAEALDTDLSVTAQADKLFRIGGPTPALVHLEMESSSRLGKPDQLMWYNTLARHQTTSRLPVYSVLMLLRPEANASDQTGLHRVLGVRGELLHEFRYTVIRVWAESVETFLNAGPAFSPLALLTDEAAADLPAAFGRYARRLSDPAVPDTLSERVISLTYVLCGLRYASERILELFMSLESIIDDSTTAQLLVQRGVVKGHSQGRLQEARGLLSRMGNRKFGPDATAQSALNAIDDITRLERIADRILDAVTWDDLLSTP